MSFTTADGATFAGVIVKASKDKLDRVWYSVKTEQSICPYLLGEDEISD